MPSKSPFVEIEVDDRVIRVSNPDRIYFPAINATKHDLVDYYLAVGPGIVNALYERPCMLHRFPKGVLGEPDEKVHQKRIPSGAPDWVETVELFFPRWKRTADELCVTELGSVIWAVQMSTVEFHPWNTRRTVVESPDEWRIDLDPGPACDYARIRRVAHVVHEVLDDLGAVGYPKTRAAKDPHLCPDQARARLPGRTPRGPRVRPRGRRRAPSEVTTAWWKKDRDPGAVFVDYNQNTRDHTIASAYSVRGSRRPVSTPIRWDEVDEADPRDFTILTVPKRFAALGDLHAEIDDHVFDITPLLEWADRDQRDDRDERAERSDG